MSGRGPIAVDPLDRHPHLVPRLCEEFLREWPAWCGSVTRQSEEEPDDGAESRAHERQGARPGPLRAEHRGDKIGEERERRKHADDREADGPHAGEAAGPRGEEEPAEDDEHAGKHRHHGADEPDDHDNRSEGEIDVGVHGIIAA